MSVSDSSKPTRKTRKGTIKVESDKGWLRIRFTYQGERKSFALDLPETKLNLTIAEQKALQIAKDIDAGHFDLTLARYKPQRQLKGKVASLTVLCLFQEFMEHKKKDVTPKTMEKYRATLGYIAKFFPEMLIDSLEMQDVEAFTKSQFSKKLSVGQVKRRLEELEACWDWGRPSYDNLWRKAAARLKVPPKQKLKPFTKQELEAIIQAFSSDCYYSFYTDFVKFLLWTGCRTGEAIGLRWKHLSDDCSSIWIGEIITRGVDRPAKGNKSRSFVLSSRVQDLLLARRSEKRKLEDLVFHSPKGKPIDDHNFSQRIWRKILKKSGIPYRKLYITRHTFASHAITKMNPTLVSEITGHDTRVLFKDYAGLISTSPTLPDI
jgi:integrase